MFRVVYIKEEDITLRPDNYNSALHRAAEHPSLAEEIAAPYDPNATDYGKYLPLIAASQAVPMESIIQCDLSSDAVRALYEASHVSILTGRVSRDIMEDLLSHLDHMPSLEKGYFIRCDETSAKDGAGSDKPIKTKEQLLNLLLTSKRMIGNYQRYFGQNQTTSSFKVYGVPWDTTMDTRREFRIFVPPCSSVETMKISGISQYQWHTAIPESLDNDKTHNAIYQGSLRILDEIKNSDLEKAKVLCQGFVFDILVREDESVVLVELNGFGASRGAGSGLYHWISDFHLLYNQDEEEICQLRICK